MFKDQLEEWCERNGMSVTTKKKTPKKRKKKRGNKKERLGFNDIKGLMGMDRATYGRKKGGAITQR